MTIQLNFYLKDTALEVYDLFKHLNILVKLCSKYIAIDNTEELPKELRREKKKQSQSVVDDRKPFFSGEV